MNVRFIQLQAVLLLFFGGMVKAQGDIGIVLGISNYQGELGSYNFQDGFRALIGPVAGVHAGYELSSRFRLRADLLYTRLSGDDELHQNELARPRNLDFFSPVIQLAGGADWHLFHFSQKDKKAFTPYVTGGVSLFYMNPMTTYQGEKIALHPLGTEGQYLVDFPDQKPYSLIQPSLLLGGGLKLLTGPVILAMEATLSYTFTDYIDDVGSIYITYPVLFEQAGPLTAALANRQGEYLNTEPVVVPTGTLRGNSETNDYFGMITFRVGVPFSIHSQTIKVRNKGSKTIKCPKF